MSISKVINYYIMLLYHNGSIHILYTREFMSLKEPIYKIGKTTKAHFTRFNQYPKGSCLLFHMICADCHTIEKILIKLFKVKYSLCKDIGNEAVTLV